MSKKKYLSKNEIRIDKNSNHFNKYGKPHKAVITAKNGHNFKANTLTHAKYVHGEITYDLDKKEINDKNHTRISPPFWQKDTLFSKETYGKIPKKYRSKVIRFNRKHKKRNPVK